MKTIEYTEHDLYEMALVLSKLSLADTFKLMTILDEEFGIRIINNVLEKPIFVGPSGGPAECPTGDMNDYNKLHKVYLNNVGVYKLQVVKTIKDLTGLGLRESKELADAASFAPSLIKECEIAEAEKIKFELANAGALVTIV